jgi:hypothetical protein
MRAPLHRHGHAIVPLRRVSTPTMASLPRTRAAGVRP